MVPNEHEAAVLTGKSDPYDAASALLAHVPEVVVTLGEKGSLYAVRDAEPIHVPAPRVKAEDTTAAGDTFVGALAVAVGEGRPMPDVRGKTVILVDDGLATGASMRAAIEALREMGAGQIVAAVPAAPGPTCRELAQLADDVVCATTPSPFLAVGASYWDFAQTSDEEVRLLRAAALVPRTAEVRSQESVIQHHERLERPPHARLGGGGSFGARPPATA